MGDATSGTAGRHAASDTAPTDPAPTDLASTLDAAAYLAVATEVFDGMDVVLATLDDATINSTPVPGVVNTVFALVTHVHGMACYWGGSVIAGERNPRDRSAEFHATGTVAEAAALLADLRTRLPGWVVTAASGEVRDPHAPGTSRTDAADASAAWILQHILHECAQHLGHMEICRDRVTRASA
jgi:hypothetical protein